MDVTCKGIFAPVAIPVIYSILLLSRVFPERGNVLKAILFPSGI
jgi:hypothetical protein